MGGKTWTKAEELLFWRTIIPQSPQATNMSDRLNSWSQCAAIMQEKMGQPRLRVYTKTMLYEHYYQNIKTRRHSPQARPFVREHMKELNKKIRARDEIMTPSVPERNPLPTSGKQGTTTALVDEASTHRFIAHNAENTPGSSTETCSPFEALLIATKLTPDKAKPIDSTCVGCSMTPSSVFSFSEAREL